MIHVCSSKPSSVDGWQQAKDESMRRRFSFDNYLGMVLFAMIGVCFLCGNILLLGPQIHQCMCPVNVPSCCTPPLLQPTWLRVYAVVFVAVLTMSLLVALMGIILGRKQQTTVDANLVYALQLCPFLTLVFLGVVTSILFFVVEST